MNQDETPTKNVTPPPKTNFWRVDTVPNVLYVYIVPIDQYNFAQSELEVRMTHVQLEAYDNAMGIRYRPQST